jgi:hypothetical protein
MTYSGSEKKTSKPFKWYHVQLEEFKRQQTGYAALAIIGQSCLGSVAVMLLLMHKMPTMVQMTFVFLVTIICMMFNAAVLAQLKSRITFNLLVLSVLFSTAIIIANLF